MPRQKLAYRYDYLGRRIGKTLYNWNGSAWALSYEHRFIYNGWTQIAEFNVVGSTLTLLRTSYWGLDLSGSGQGAGGVGGLLMTQESDGNSYLTVSDIGGNIHAMIKASDASVAAAYEYDGFGNTVRESGPYAASNPFRYSTKYTDVETGLVYYGLRYYSPSLGRFINRDPIEEQGGVNLYGFVGNNGVNNWDYLGLKENSGGLMEFPPFVTTVHCRPVEYNLPDGGHVRMMTCDDGDSWITDFQPGYQFTTFLPPQPPQPPPEPPPPPRPPKPSDPTEPGDADKNQEKRKKDCATLKAMMGVYANIGRGQIDEIGVTGQELNRAGDFFAFGGLALVTVGSAFDIVNGARSAAKEAMAEATHFNNIVDGIPFLLRETADRWKSGNAASIALATYTTETLKSGTKALGEYWLSTEIIYNKVNDVLHDTINAEMRSLSLNHADTLNRLKNTQNDFKTKGCDEFY